ncbi:MAG: hypothetical protein UEE41_01545 [Acutalibacteraceae bacterium]|nr:hypothetical protein [Acutalibacteraceae bacterium]
MTDRQIKICSKILRYKKLGAILKKTKIKDYRALQDEFKPNSLNFSDTAINDETLVSPCNELRDEFDNFRRKNIHVYIAEILSVIAIIVSVISLIKANSV